MKITYEPLTPESPVNFIVYGFPEDEKIRQEVENFYKTMGQQAHRKFFVNNTFKEIIFSGSARETGEIAEFVVSERQGKNHTYPEKESGK